MQKWAAIALPLALLGACATSQPFVPPTGGDTAKLLIRPTVPAGMAFKLDTFEDQHTCRNRQRILAGDARTGNQSSALRAGSLAPLEYVGAERRRTCTLSFSFHPKAQHTYLLATSQDSNRCMARLLDVTDPDTPRPEKSFMRRTRNANGCEPLNSKQLAVESIDEVYQGMPKEGEAGSVRRLDDFKDLLPE